MSFSTSLPPSFLEGYSLPAGSIPGVGKGASSIPLYDIDFNAPLPIDPALAYSGKFDLSGSAFNTAWTFICAPEDISWDTSNAVQRIGIFGTNNPPVVSGSRGMRDLTLGNALVEGFIRNVTVEKKILALEKLLNYRPNLSDGFVSVPVYRVKANDKAYGNSGLFVIKEVRVKESMRDLKGDATRATVDISFMEVPEYQVNSGRDLASKAAAAVKARALPDAKETRNAQQAAVKAAASAQAEQGVGTAGKPVAGANSAKPDPNKPKAKDPTTFRQRGVSVAPKKPGQ
jgi:hypothetical protein